YWPTRALSALRSFSLLSRFSISADHRAGTNEQARAGRLLVFRLVQSPGKWRGRGFSVKADELSDAYSHFRSTAPLLSRDAGAPGRIRHGVPLGTIGRARRDDPGSWFYSG